jgi:NTP pyrophosphatase (non-canonical NTP hydrolase)
LLLEKKMELSYDIASCNTFTNDEDEALTILMEECGEVIQACAKIIRFGASPDNVRQLVQEIGDVYCLTDIMQRMDLISYTDIEAASNAKYEKLKRFSNLPLD